MKKKLLWIALNPPCKKNVTAGGKTFNYYYQKFKDSGLFDIHLIALCNDSFRSHLEPSVAQEKLLLRQTDIMSKIKRLSSIESKLNPWNRNGNLISNQFEKFVIKSARQFKQEDFIPDVIILEWTQCVVLAEKIKRIFPDAKLIASEHDVTFVKYEREAQFEKTAKNKIKTIKAKNEKRVELAALSVCDLILVQNPDNADILVKEGIQKEAIRCIAPFIDKFSGAVRGNIKKDIVFYGAMKRPENYLTAIWFIENVMPLIRDKNCRFIVAGNMPPQQLEAYRSDRVVITGFVDSMMPYFEQSMCFAAPLVLGAGIKVKVLEAMSSGIPVLANSIGIEGIHVQDKKDYLHCETAQEYADAINDMCSCTDNGSGYDKYIQMGANAKKIILNQFDEESSAQSYLANVLELTRR